MEPSLRDTLSFSYWVLTLGVALIVVAVVWVVGVWLSYRRSRSATAFRVRPLGQVQYERYMRQIGEVQQSYQAGELDPRQAHLALAALIRASATERTRLNMESATPAEARAAIPSWPVLGDALVWCADSSFPADLPAERSDERVRQGVDFAMAVVRS